MPDWDQAPDFGRRETLLRALRRLHELRPGPVCIVETGTLRNDTPSGREGDGWSTVAWGWYCTQVGGKAYTVDINAGNLEVCRRVTAPYADALEYVNANSLDFFHRWADERPEQIGLLYLDSLDYINHAESEEHHRAEAEAALPLLATSCLVLIDDTCPAGEPNEDGVPLFGGKGARAIPFLLGRGFLVEWHAGGQVLLSRGGDLEQKTRERLSDHRTPTRIMTGDWAELTAEEREHAMDVATHEGRRAARWYLEEAADRNSGGRLRCLRPRTGEPAPAGGPRPGAASFICAALRAGRWFREHPDLSGLEDDALLLCARAQTTACERHYTELFIEPFYWEHAAPWQARDRKARLDDLRVCCFCDGYERERCRILALPDPPADITDLEEDLEDAKEQERTAARGWLASTEQADALASDGAGEAVSLARREYRQRTLVTELARMLLDAALHRLCPGPA